MVKKLLFLFILLGSLTLAREAIEEYAIQIELKPDASLTVQEDLLVRVENDAINHGIYRDLLTRPPAATGPASQTKIKYSIEDTRLDDHPIPWFVRTAGETMRVYIGDSQQTVPPGLHKFSLRYRVRYAVVKSGNRARLDWNLTGNSWRFPIYGVNLHIFLPPQLRATDVHGRVFYGPLGSTVNLPLMATSERALGFSYSRTLPPGSGLTLQLEWPAALLEPPPAPLDPTLRVLLLALLASVLTNAAAWHRAGRDPYAGPIIPRFEPPKNASAPLAAYLMNSGYSTRAFGAAVAQLSQQGFIKIDSGRKIVLQRTEQVPSETIPLELRNFYHALFGGGQRKITIDENSIGVLQNAQDALKGSLGVLARPLFRNNSLLSLVSQAINALALGWFAYQSGGDFAFAAFAIMAYIFYVVLGAEMLKHAALSWERYRLIPGLSPLGELFRTGFLLIGLLFPPLFTALLAGAFYGFATGLVIGLLVLSGALAAYLIPAYSLEGVKLRNHLLGLARFLGTTDEAALKRIGAPEDIPKRLSELFPYAVALGLEAPFGRRLEAFAKLHPDQAKNVIIYNRPLTTYTEAGMSPVNLGGYTTSISQALRAAAARAQSSSGGGFSGGGFSGGGGGGGGGGGW